MSTRLRNVMRLELGSFCLGVSQISLAQLVSVSPVACSGEDTATLECQQHLVVVDPSAGRLALG